MAAPRATDLIDRVDARNVVCGTVPRGEALASGANFRTAHVLLEAADGRYALQRLGDGVARHTGLWGSSAAAYLHVGESYEAAVRRRTYEELNIRPVLAAIADLEFAEVSSTKFVRVFRGRYEPVEIRLLAHTGAIELVTVDDMQRLASASALTPTLAAIVDTVLAV